MGHGPDRASPLPPSVEFAPFIESHVILNQSFSDFNVNTGPPGDLVQLELLIQWCGRGQVGEILHF